MTEAASRLRPPSTEHPGGRTVVRAPNHVGDVVLALPAMAASGADVVIVRRLAPLLEMAGLRADVIPFDRGPRGFARAVRALRRNRYRRGVLLSAAFSAAWLFRWGGVGRLRGTGTDGRSFLLREVIDPTTLRGRHRVDAFRLLAGLDEHVSLAPARLVPPADRVERWRARLDASATRPGESSAGGRGARPSDLASDTRWVGIFPGANAPARRWPVDRFAAVAHQLVGSGLHVAVLGGPAERALTAPVARAAPEAVDLGGATDLVDLAAILSLCDLVITNDTGPMHLAGAVGTPTVSLWGSSDPDEVRQTGAADAPVSGIDLPCKPCYRNECHRRGRGTLLADAYEECMRTIDAQEVARAALAALDGGRARE